MMNLDFGKYKGKDIEEVYNIDEKYAFWVFNWPQAKAYPEIYDFLKKKFRGDCFYMYYGKYKGKSIKWIKENDKKYIYYLKNNEFAQGIPELVKALENC